MKKICLTVVGMYLLMLHAYAQFTQKDSAQYKSKPLKIEEVNLVSSYYTQQGNHSAVTGGIGTEQVTDFANGLDVKWVGWDAKARKNTLSFNLGIDHHTSASSAYVSKTGASKTDGSRIYPSLNWSRENEEKGTGFGLGAYVSSEYNYKSFGVDAQFSKKTKSNGEFTAKVTGYFDKVKLIYPSELIPTPTITTTPGGPIYITTATGRKILSGGGSSNEDEKSGIPSSPRNTVTGSLSFTQIINTRMQVAFLTDVVYQNGYLGLPFHRVYLTDGTVKVENLPSSRVKLPLGFRLNYFIGDNIILKSYYRFYTDDWGLRSHTASLEVPVKITPFFSLSPFYRYYTQTAVKYFQPYEETSTTAKYYTSNYALSAFNSQFFGMGTRIAPPKGIVGPFNSMELRYGHYTQTTDLVSDVISVNLTFK
jgi:Protein of unknown function (DUF3570)